MSGSRQQIALVSDVHGNLTALEAVLADVDARGIERVFNLGDFVGKGPRGREVVAICRGALRGQPARQLGRRRRRPRAGRRRPRLVARRARRRPGRLAGRAPVLPRPAGQRTPGAAAARLPETVHRRVRYVKTEEEFLGMFANTPATVAAVGETPEPDVVGYGDTHDPSYETQLRSRTLFNTGSAGNAMGDPTASYVVLDGVVDGTEPAPFALTFVRVPYDVEAELAVAREAGVPHYAGYEAELRLGLYRGAVADYEAGAFDLDTYYHAVPR